MRLIAAFYYTSSRIRKRPFCGMSGAAGGVSAAEAPSTAACAADNDKRCNESAEPTSESALLQLRDIALNSSLTSVFCYGLSRCVIQAQAADGQSILLNCQQTLDFSDSDARALLRDPGTPCVLQRAAVCVVSDPFRARLFCFFTSRRRRTARLADSAQWAVFKVAPTGLLGVGGWGLGVGGLGFVVWDW